MSSTDGSPPSTDVGGTAFGSTSANATAAWPWIPAQATTARSVSPRWSIAVWRSDWSGRDNLSLLTQMIADLEARLADPAAG